MLLKNRYSLKQEIVTNFLFLAFIVLAIIGSMGGFYLFKSQVNLVSAIQHQVALRVSEEISGFLSNDVYVFRKLLRFSDFEQHSIDRQERLLHEFLHLNKNYEYIVLMTKNKEILYKEHRLQPRSFSFTSSQLTDALVKEVNEGREVSYGPVNYSSATAEPSVLIAIPVLNTFSAEVDYVIFLSIRFRNIWNLMAREYSQSNYMVSLVTEENVIIAHNNPSLVLNQNQVFHDTDRSINQGTRGDLVISAKVPLQLGNLNYSIIAEKNLKEVLLDGWSGVVGLLLVLLMIFSVSIVMGYYFSKRITKPLDELMLGVQSVARGDLSKKLSLKVNNEFGSLAQYFNSMTLNLAQLISDLELKSESLKKEVASRKQAEIELRELNHQLEFRIAERTKNLKQALENLEVTQASLIQSEKLAGLGSMVAGVSHELNTPIGNALMMSSTMKEKSDEFALLCQQGLRKSDLSRFLEFLKQSSDIILVNLNQSARLISSFKQIAVDQTSHQRRKFFMSEILDEIMITMAPTLRRSKVSVEVLSSEDVQLNSYPGPLGQVLLNILNNALIHAFDPPEEGKVDIHVESNGHYVTIMMKDNGAGMTEEVLSKIFNPFFTTKLGQGGSGLGMSISHNLVSGILQGSLQVTSKLGSGSCFKIIIPRDVTMQLD